MQGSFLSMPWAAFQKKNFNFSILLLTLPALTAAILMAHLFINSGLALPMQRLGVKALSTLKPSLLT